MKTLKITMVIDDEVDVPDAIEQIEELIEQCPHPMYIEKFSVDTPTLGEKAFWAEVQGEE